MKKKLLLMLCLCSLVFCGCGGPNAALYSKKHVLNAVAEVVPSEKYSLISIEKQEGNVRIYHFKSDERELYFDAVSYRDCEKVDGEPVPLSYYKALDINYDEAVMQLYLEPVKEMLKSNTLFKSTEYVSPSLGYYCFSYDRDAEYIAFTVGKADSIYQEELKYNSAEWLKEHPLYTIDVAYQVGDDRYFMPKYEINGSLNKDLLIKHMQAFRDTEDWKLK